MDPTNTDIDIDIRAHLKRMSFGKQEGKGEVNQKRFLQTSHLQGKVFH